MYTNLSQLDFEPFVDWVYARGKRWRVDYPLLPDFSFRVVWKKSGGRKVAYFRLRGGSLCPNSKWGSELAEEWMFRNWPEGLAGFRRAKKQLALERTRREEEAFQAFQAEERRRSLSRKKAREDYLLVRESQEARLGVMVSSLRTRDPMETNPTPFSYLG